MKIVSIRNILKFIFFILLVFLVVLFFPYISDVFSRAEKLMQTQGILGPIIYMIIMALSIIIVPFPSSPLVIIGSMIFGPISVMIYSLISATIGALIAFSLSRFFFRDFFKEVVEKHLWYKKLEGKSEKNIAYFVLISRFMPQISFDIVSYAAGLTAINFFVFALVTFIGMIPIVFILSFFGYLIKPYQEIVLIVMFIVFLIYFGYYIIKNIMSKK